MNVVLVGLPTTGRIAAFNYAYEPISHFSLPYAADEGGRYAVLPLLVMTNAIGQTSAVLYDEYLKYGGDMTYDEYEYKVSQELVEGHLTALLFDLKERRVFYIDINSLGLYLYMEPERVKIYEDANLKEVDEFLTRNAKMCEFDNTLANSDSPTQDSSVTSRYHGFSVERINTLPFLIDVFDTLPEEYEDHIGVCVPTTFIILEWMIDGGGLNERLQVLKENGMPLHAFILEFAKTTVEQFYTASVLGIEGGGVEYNKLVANPGVAYKWVRLMLQDHFEKESQISVYDGISFNY